MKHPRKYADLHLHSNASDGTYGPADVLKKAKQAGLGCIAVTDHDTIDNVSAVLDLSGPVGIEVIPGIEFSVSFDAPLHLLAYFFDPSCSALVTALAKAKKYRLERIREILHNVRKTGIQFPEPDIESAPEGKSWGRPHVARLLLTAGAVRSYQEAFDLYLSRGKPGYVPKKKMPLDAALDIVAAARGIPVLAHPLSLGDDTLIPKAVKAGVAGIEAYYSDHTPNDVAYYLDVARRHRLLVTGGSDWHGQAKEHVELGCVRLPYTYVEKLKEYKEKKL